MDKKVLFIQPPSGGAKPIHEVREAIQRIADLELLKVEYISPAQVKDVDALLPGPVRVTRDLFDAANRLKLIALFGVGFDHIDLKAATDHGVIVTNVPTIMSESVAEHTILLILAVTRRIIPAERMVRANEWKEKRGDFDFGTELWGKTLGIVGLGNIGSRVAEKSKAFNMKVIAYDPYVSGETATSIGASLTSLEVLLRSSDIISIHVPLSSSTKRMIGRKEISLMKETAYLINTARGDVVDEEALTEALQSRRIAGAALDVLSPEPPLPANPLLKLDNVVLTPHIASWTREVSIRTGQAVADTVVRVLTGGLPQPPANVVNPEVLVAIS